MMWRRWTDEYLRGLREIKAQPETPKQEILPETWRCGDHKRGRA